MRLIDAEKLVDMLYDNEFAVLCPLDEVSGVVDACPTVDAVPIVRCKDCKYYTRSELLAPNKFCFRLKHPAENRVIGYNFAPDDFCSYGERREGGKDD